VGAEMKALLVGLGMMCIIVCVSVVTALFMAWVTETTERKAISAIVVVGLLLSWVLGYAAVGW
jgi:hypothetical protein